MRIDLPQKKYGTPETRSSFWEQFQSRVGALPGVETVGLVSELPFEHDADKAISEAVPA
jgi:hypothetical protein